METVEMNKKVIVLLKQWDPFETGENGYEHEIADVITELHRLDYPTDLAKRIREIYEQSYALWIPLENCMKISYKLLAVKYEAKSIV